MAPAAKRVILKRMTYAALPPHTLQATACRDGRLLQRFVTDHISVNAWPIHSPVLVRRIEQEGLDQGLAREFELNKPQLVAMMRHMYRASRRVERTLAIDNPFHCAMHNFEVFIRLLVLEWPHDAAMPEAVARAPLQAYATLESVLPVALGVIEALQGIGVSGSAIARDALTALGHDYGHTGGTDRTDANGRTQALTHEEMAEKHVAGMGLRFGYPPALVLESMAGIRATTFHHRPGRLRVQADNAFERRITLADVMGCVLPPGQWLTHVGAPVLLEKIPFWKQRSREIAVEMQSLQEQTLANRNDSGALASFALGQKELAAERVSMIEDVGEWFRSEHGFFVFIKTHKLEPVPGARKLWGAIVDEKIAVTEVILSKAHLLSPLAALGAEFLETFACQMSNTACLKDRLQQDDIDVRLRELLQPFIHYPSDPH